MAAVNTLYDMCNRPEQVISLREELAAAFQVESQSWQFSTIKQLKVLDSLMKEWLRYSQPDTRKHSWQDGHLPSEA